MDRSIPPAAAILLDFIRKTEVGRKDRASYDVIYGHKQHKLAKPLTSMTIGEIVDAQKSWSKSLTRRRAVLPLDRGRSGKSCRGPAAATLAQRYIAPKTE